MTRYVCRFSSTDLQQEETDFLVIGSGVAGLVTAIAASDKGQVLLLTKDTLEETNTYHAQGGIASAIGDNDSPALHLEDTLLAGDGHCNRDAVKFLVEQGPAGIAYLIDQGVNFDQEEGHLALTKEAAHCRRRVLHADGDASGREVMRALRERVLQNRRITICEHAQALDLLIKDTVCQGALVLVGDEKKIIWARETILATGGIGKIYQMTTNPDIATGDGLAMAYRAGAVLCDLEFVQFHPTAFCQVGVTPFLISEAVRGEGAYLLDCRGQRFMLNSHPLGELASRDVVARAIFAQMQKTNHHCVYLSLAHLDKELVGRRFPNLSRRCAELGLVFSKDLIPVAPAAHYFMGGIQTDCAGRTNIAGLSACGEVACTGVHGANRLASNSLLEGLIFGLAIADRLTESKGLLLKDYFSSEKSRLFSGDVEQIKTEIQQTMSQAAAIIREENTLLQAALHLQDRLEMMAPCDLQTKEQVEVGNMLTVAHLIVDSACKREESRGAHYRLDYPLRENSQAQRYIIQKRS